MATPALPVSAFSVFFCLLVSGCIQPAAEAPQKYTCSDGTVVRDAALCINYTYPTPARSVITTPTPDARETPAPRPTASAAPTPTPGPTMLVNCPRLLVTVRDGFGRGTAKRPESAMAAGDSVEIDPVRITLSQISVCAILGQNESDVVWLDNGNIGNRSILENCPDNSCVKYCGKFDVDPIGDIQGVPALALGVEDFDLDVKGTPYRLQVRTDGTCSWGIRRP